MSVVPSAFRSLDCSLNLIILTPWDKTLDGVPNQKRSVIFLKYFCSWIIDQPLPYSHQAESLVAPTSFVEIYFLLDILVISLFLGSSCGSGEIGVEEPGSVYIVSEMYHPFAVKVWILCSNARFPPCFANHEAFLSFLSPQMMKSGDKHFVFCFCSKKRQTVAPFCLEVSIFCSLQISLVYNLQWIFWLRRRHYLVVEASIDQL